HRQVPVADLPETRPQVRQAFFELSGQTVPEFRHRFLQPASVNAGRSRGRRRDNKSTAQNGRHRGGSGVRPRATESTNLSSSTAPLAPGQDKEYRGKTTQQPRPANGYWAKRMSIGIVRCADR